MDIHIRRGRRTDYAALAALCSWPRDEQRPQRSLRLFRRTVSDLAYDLYVADHLGEPVGVVAVSYVRELGLGGQRATLARLPEQQVAHDQQRPAVAEKVERPGDRAVRPPPAASFLRVLHHVPCILQETWAA